MNPSLQNEAIAGDPHPSAPSADDLFEREGSEEAETGLSASTLAETLRLARAM